MPEGWTILEACRAQGIETPTLCYLETLTPVNVCRVCVVEVEGSRVLVPACSRKVEPGMMVKTDSERVRLSRKMVLEFLASSVDLSLASDESGDTSRATARTRSATARRRRRRPRGSATRPGRPSRAAPGGTAAAVAQPVKVDNDLYVRDYSQVHPLLQVRRGLRRRRPEHLRHLRWRAAASTPASRPSTRRPLPDSACVYCGNCIGVCPTGALMFKSEHDMRQAGTWDEAKQTVTDTICPYCGVGCTLELHVQDNTIVKVTSPLDSRRDPRPPLHQGALRLAVRPEPPRRGAPRRAPGKAPERRR